MSETMPITLYSQGRSAVPSAFNSMDEMQVFYYQAMMQDGRHGFFFLLAPVALRDHMDAEMQRGEIPAEAAILAAGDGEPDEKTWFDMERYFGYRRPSQSLAA